MSRTKRNWAVLSIATRGGADGLEFVGHIRADRFPGGTRESGTLLREDLLDRLKAGDREICAVCLDERGNELGRHGFPAAARSVHEYPMKDVPERITFNMRRDWNGPRQFDVRVPPNGRWVVFYAAKLQGGRIKTTPLLTLLLDRGEKMEPPLPEVPGLSPLPAPKVLKFSSKLDESWLLDDESDSDGFLGADVETTHPRARPGSRFDVVFIGDGFTELEMDRYNELARSLRDGIRATEPFKRLDDKMNYHIVRAVSAESGISGFDPRRTEQGMAPDPKNQKRTYFGFMSDPHSYGAPGYFAAGPMRRVRRAARKVSLAWSEIDLVIAIMNCPYVGGAGYLEHRMAIVSTDGDEGVDRFVARTLHECGHAICGLAEEHITADRFEAGERYPNMATERQRITKSVWWWKLARPAEKGNQKGEFAVVHEYEQKLTAKDGVHIIPALSEAKLRKLGLFWGAQCVDGDLGYDPDQPFEMTLTQLHEAWSAAADYYRPMVYCRMRTNADKFCRVCDRVIADSIRAAANGVPRTSPLRGRPKTVGPMPSS